MPLCKISRQLYADRKVHKQRMFVVQQSLVILGTPKENTHVGVFTPHAHLPSPALFHFMLQRINSQIILHLLLA